jgi:CobQ-like glutamine amidotransferase family enzyme
MELKICHLYPDLLNLYGDRGNTVCMEKRLQWRGIDCRFTEVKYGDNDPLSDYDLIFIGGGQDFEQKLLMEDLQRGKGNNIKAAAEDGKTFLAICGGYQLLGHYYQMSDGTKCEYIGAIDVFTVAGEKRMIGNTACISEEAGTIVGFENHAGKTFLSGAVRSLGTVLKGSGNNGEDGLEGARYKNVFATYYHGPVLPKNPELCDLILKTALGRKYGIFELRPLDDSAENAAKEGLLRSWKL